MREGMSRRQHSASGGAGQGGVVTPHAHRKRGYLTLTLECRIEVLYEVWHGEAHVLVCRCDGRRYVAVAERVGLWYEIIETRARWTWAQALRVARELAERHDVCVGWEAYDVCLSEEVGKLAETIVELSRRI